MIKNSILIHVLTIPQLSVLINNPFSEMFTCAKTGTKQNKTKPVDPSKHSRIQKVHLNVKINKKQLSPVSSLQWKKLGEATTTTTTRFLSIAAIVFLIVVLDRTGRWILASLTVH